jgi:DNA-directed RNA polymerase I, II, and III subunit RPABC5
MIIPIRCFSCGKVVGNLWEQYVEKVTAEPDCKGRILDELGLRRICCRRMLLTHVDLMDKMLAQSTETKT